jgi:hypothetical protein
MANISFKPKQVTKKILSPLQDRAYDVVFSRFGLGDDAERKTLEAIGKQYGITRERVRQIENAALSTIKKAETFKEAEVVFKELAEVMHELGAVVAEEDFLEHISKDKATQNHVHLYLVLGDEFKKEKEDEDFRARWIVDEEVSREVHESLRKLYASLSDEDLISENELVSRFLDNLKNVADKYRNEEIARRWLGLSKNISKNPLGEYGKAESSNVKTRGIKDYAFLMMRKHGSPMHFREVAKAIGDTFNKKCHTATCHNELIKDSRFVLVGRGTYGLSEWGYKKGIVRDVIKEILKKEGPLSKDDVVDKVSKERFLKKNTILVNLQNPKYFKKNKNGLYSVA